MHTRRARFNHRFHQLVSIQRAAKARFRVRDDRRKPIRPGLLAFRELDLVRAQQCTIDTLHEVRRGITRIEALVGIHVACGIAIGGHLPATAINRFQPGLHHFNGLIAGDGAERRNVGIRVHQIPQPLRAKPRQRVLNLDRAAQPQHIRVRVRTCDAGPAGIGGPVIERMLLVAVTVTIDPVHSVG